MNFPYKRDSAGEFYPIVDLFADYKGKTAKIFTLLDSGASISIFKPEVAEYLVLDIEKGKTTYLCGV